MDPKTIQAIKMVKVLKISFIVAGLLFLYVVFTIPSKATRQPQPTFELVIAAVGVTNVILGFVLPGFIARAAARSQSSTRPSTPLQSWMSGCVLSLALFQACNLFAVVLHFVGAPAVFVESLFAAGLLAMLFWSPGAPPSEEDTLYPQVFTGT